MKFIIKNIGTIVNATIELNSLTIISGENNSGKTTISKIVYAIGQASSSFPVDYKRHQYNECRNLYEELALNIHRLIRINEDSSNKDTLDDLMNAVMGARRSNEVTEYDFSLIKNLTEETVKSLEDNESNSIRLKKIYSVLDKLKVFYNDYKYNDPIDKFIHRALKNEFSDEILNKKFGASEAYLALYDDDIPVFEITFTNNKILEFKADLNKIPIKDSTLIEGPYIFQLAPIIHEMTVRDSLYRRSSSRINSKIPYHILDLCSKLDGSNISDIECSINNPVNLKNFYDGNIEFKREINSFELIQGGLTYNTNNVSSGMKSIAILDLLCRGYFINSETVLIVDEPETNLHPKWQKLYAKALIELANNGTRILVNTHSPYMLEALKIYSEQSTEKLGSKFYFSEKRDNIVIFEDTQGNIIPIIDALSAPLYDLMTELEDVDNF